jgi:hypothetical protein
MRERHRLIEWTLTTQREVVFGERQILEYPARGAIPLLRVEWNTRTKARSRRRLRGARERGVPGFLSVARGKPSAPRYNMNSASNFSPAVAMMNVDAGKSGQITSLIAYLSLCMLAAAFGAALGPGWSRWWAIFGLFGLASAIGLNLVNRARVRRAERAQNERLTVRIAQKLDEMVSDMEVSDAIHATLRQLQPSARNSTAPDARRQAETRLPLDRPATIWRLFRSSRTADYRRGESLAGQLRNVSHCGFSIAHDQRLERGLALLEFEMEIGRTMQFIADVLWCELQEDGGYLSGGKLLEELSPNDPRLEQFSVGEVSGAPGG